VAHTIDHARADHTRTDDNDGGYGYDTNDRDHRYQHVNRHNDPAHRKLSGQCRRHRSARPPDKNEWLQARPES